MSPSSPSASQTTSSSSPLSPQRPNPFAIEADPLSDSEGEISGVRPTAARNRTSTNQKQNTPKARDGLGIGLAGAPHQPTHPTSSPLPPNHPNEIDEDEDEPPSSLLYENTPAQSPAPARHPELGGEGEDDGGRYEPPEGWDPRRGKGGRVGNRDSLEAILRGSGEVGAGVDQVDEWERDDSSPFHLDISTSIPSNPSLRTVGPSTYRNRDSVNATDLTSSLTPQPYDAHRSRMPGPGAAALGGSLLRIDPGAGMGIGSGSGSSGETDTPLGRSHNHNQSFRADPPHTSEKSNPIGTYNSTSASDSTSVYQSARGRHSDQSAVTTTTTGGITSTSLSTFRSNSASPPPDLLDSGSGSEGEEEGDMESLDMGNGNGDGRDLTGRRGGSGSGEGRAEGRGGSSKGKGKEKERTLGGKAYAQVDVEDEDDDLEATEGELTRPDAKDNINNHSPPPSTTTTDHLSRSTRSGRHRDKHKRKHRSRKSDGAGEGDDPDNPLLAASKRMRKERRRMKEAARGLSEREKALWSWVNVVDLDGYLNEVYEYYVGKGLYCIALRRILNLLTSGFVIVFSTFLFSCIDYSAFPSDGHGQLSDVIVPHCSSRWSVPHIILTWILVVVFAWRILIFGLGVRKLLELKAFYEHLLNIPTNDIQTIPWAEVVRRIGEIRDDNPTTSLKDPDGDELPPDGEQIKLDAHDVANRILRQENYLIALFNKDLLDLRVRIPLPRRIASAIPSSLVLHDDSDDRFFLCFGQNSLTKVLEWNLRFCLLDYLFDERRHVRKEFIRGRNREEAIAKLRNRFIFMGVINAVFAPFIILYLLMYSFFRYFEEYHKNPSSIGSRQYNPYARWKFREFNELPHLFERRLDESYEAAKQYIDQFPKEVTALSMRFVAFIAGAFAAVLVLLSVIDPVFLHFEITQDRTVLFYLGVFTSILAVSRGTITQEVKVFSPEELISEVVVHTHYMPDEWRAKLHSQDVHAEFSKLFALKLTIFLKELLSVLLTPFILCFSLPRSSAAIIDFFREFTVHVEGIGYVCSFAVFDFKRQGKVQEPVEVDEGVKKRLFEGNRKMEKSFLHFKITNPAWQPSDPSASLFLSKVADSDAHFGNGHSLSVGNGHSKPNGSLSRYFNTNGRSRSALPPPDSPHEEQRLREKSNLYERALQRSIMLKGTSDRPSTSSSGNCVLSPGERSASAMIGKSFRLPMTTMEESEERDGEEEGEEGWETRMIRKREEEGMERSEEGRGGKGDGVLDMLQDVIRR